MVAEAHMLFTLIVSFIHVAYHNFHYLTMLSCIVAPTKCAFSVNVGFSFRQILFFIS